MKAQRVLLLMVFSSAIFAQCLAQTTIGRQKVDQYPTTSWGTLTYGLTWLPTDYDSSYASSTKYPLIIFLHGSGEGGDGVSGLNNLITQGLPYQISKGMNPEAVNPADGKRYKFIVVSPQAPSAAHWSYSYTQVQWILPNVISRYRIDTTRIYVTGLSAGGAGTMSCVTNGPDFAKKIAAIVPVSCAGTNTQAEADQIPLIGGTYGVKVWNVCGALDAWYAWAQTTTNTINTANPPPVVPAILTGIPGVGHQSSAWNPPYDVNWRSNSENLSTFEWMLKWQRIANGPSASAGAGQTITLPANQVGLNGSATPSSGNSINSYSWARVSGPATYTIASPSSASTNITNLVQGTYVFRLTATESTGATATSDVTVVVNPAPNVLPVANAGTDIAITLPVNTVTLNGSGSDTDGSISTYSWSKISGPAQYSIVSPSNAQTAVNNLAQGVYQFQLTVTDNSGATAKDTVLVTVNPAPNIPPVANAGSDQIITLPLSSVVVNGSGTDTDGTVISYGWTKISGPSSFTIATPDQAQTTISNLVQGTYQFALRVTDNLSATAYDTVSVIVNPAANIPPTVNSGNDVTITLPQDSVILTGTASDADGSISSYQWTKISGPSQFLLVAPSQVQSIIRNLTQGIYQFELTVIDNNGGTAKDTVKITVNPYVNTAPVVNAGNDTTITLPVSSVALSGTATDADGSIAAYSWSKISGPAQYNILTPTQPQTTVSNLMQGTYQFLLSAVDNNGATAVDTVNVVVNGTAAVKCNGIKRMYVPGGDGGKYLSGNPAASTWYKPINPGDTLVLDGKYSWSYFSIAEYSGTVECPIVIQNSGDVWLTAGLQVNNCKYVKIAGDGDPAIYYGFKVYNPAQDLNGVGVTITGKSKNIEVERVDVYRKTYGVWAKQDPDCDQSYDYPNFIMDSIEIHHCRFKNIGQDCIYAGTTDPLGKRTIYCSGQPVNYIPMRLSNINLHHLIIDSCNRTGIQLTGANSGYNQIHDNVITRCGYEYVENQGTGIAIGGMTRNCHVYNNTIKNTYLYGIMSFGVGTNYIENNLIDSTGWLDGAPNTVSRPYNIMCSPKETIPFDSTRIIIRNNKLGVNSTTDGTNVGVVVWGPPTWAAGNVLCSNTTLDGVTPAKMFVDPTIKYINDCSQGLPNVPPSAFAGNDIIINPVGDTVLRGTASDPDGTVISYKWTKISGPAQFTINSADSINTSISNLVQGIYVFRLTVMDNDSLTATDDIQVSVAPPNTAPIANAGANQTITLPLNYFTLNGSAIDADGNIASYKWTKISGPASLAIVDASKLVTQVNNLVQGSYQFELLVTDNLGAQDKDTVVITVNPAPPPTNSLPVANAGNDINITLPTNFVTLNGTGSDSDGTITSYQWTKVSGPVNYFFNSATQSQTNVGNLDVGVYQFELKVIDNVGAISRDTVAVTVSPVPNIPPLVNAGADQTINLPLNSVTLNGTGMVADGNIVNFTWTKLTGPSQYTIVSPNQLQTVIGNLSQGVYQFELMALDNLGAIGRDTVTITVNFVPNVAPTANAGMDQAITLPVNSATLNGSGVDTDGTIVSYQWTKISGPGQYLIVSASQQQTTVNNLVQGVYQFELTVTDNNGAVGKDVVQITVNATPNVPPVANAGPDQTIKLPVSSVLVNGTGVDVDGTIVSYQWNKISGPASSTIGNAGSSVTFIHNLAQGVYQFELTVTDNVGATGKDTVTISVNPAINVPPIAKAGSDQTITLPTNSVTLAGSGNDNDGFIVGYNWVKISGPAQGSISTTSQAQTSVTGLVEGIYQFGLTVTDNQGATGKDTVTVIVHSQSAVSTATIYPNPATTTINIKIDGVTHRNQTTIKIYDMSGVMVYSEEFLRTQPIEVRTIDVTKLLSGSYIVKVAADINSEVALKFIKQ